MLARMTLALAIAVSLLACDSPAATVRPTLPTPGPVSTFADDIMSFEYPSNWNAAKFDDLSTLTPLIVHLSTEPLVNPCHSDSTGTVCGSPVEQLGQDGLLISWRILGVPGPSPSPIPNPSAVAAEVGGRPAVVTQENAAAECADIGGEQELFVQIADTPMPRNAVEMHACVSGPNYELTGATIAAMLASVEWKN